MAEQAPYRAAIGQAEHDADLRRNDLPVAVEIGMGDRLVEDRQTVADRSFGRHRDQVERLGFSGAAFFSNDLGKMLFQHVDADAPEVEALAARQDGDRQLVNLGRRENELHMRRWFLERLQQPVERGLRQHVDFVDDVDLVARRNRSIA